MFHHYSPVPNMTIDKKIVYAQTLDMKPTGLWFTPDGVADSWRDFCEAEQFALDRFKHRLDFNLDTTNILVIDTAEGIDSFAEEYQWKEEREFYAYTSNRFVIMDWGRFAQEYKGIIISPYQWSQRLGKHLWYYGWDCASGCVWDLSAVKDIPLLEYKGG